MGKRENGRVGTSMVADDWLPECFDKSRNDISLNGRADTPPGESFRAENMRKAGGCPENADGWGNVESKMHLVAAPKWNAQFYLAKNIFALDLPNFSGPYLLDKPFWGKRCTSTNNKILRHGTDWGIGRNMKEINLYE